jgi:hypothetical protein
VRPPPGGAGVCSSNSPLKNVESTGVPLWCDDDYGYGAQLVDLSTKTPARTWSALYQQRPAPEEGDYFHAERSVLIGLARNAALVLVAARAAAVVVVVPNTTRSRRRDHISLIAPGLAAHQHFAAVGVLNGKAGHAILMGGALCHPRRNGFATWKRPTACLLATPKSRKWSRRRSGWSRCRHVFELLPLRVIRASHRRIRRQAGECGCMAPRARYWRNPAAFVTGASYGAGVAGESHCWWTLDQRRDPVISRTHTRRASVQRAPAQARDSR